MRYVPYVVVAICVLLLWGTALADEKKVHLIAQTVLCDEKAQLVDILEASERSGQFEDSRFTFQVYASQRNHIGEPVCALMADPYPYLIHNEYVRVRSISPETQAIEDFYVVRVSYASRSGLSEGYIMLNKAALDEITKEVVVGQPT